MLARVCAGVTVPLVGWENPPESTQISRCGGTVARQHTWRCTWQRAPPHILTTYICQLSQLQAPGQHRQHRQPGAGAGSPVSQSTNIVIYLSSSRQSPASGAAALGHSHTFTSPSLAQLCPWPSQQLSDCKQCICTQNISYSDPVQNIKFLRYAIETNLWHSPKDLIIRIHLR